MGPVKCRGFSLVSFENKLKRGYLEKSGKLVKAFSFLVGIWLLSRRMCWRWFDRNVIHPKVGVDPFSIIFLHRSCQNQIRFPGIFGGLERRSPGTNGEVTPRKVEPFPPKEKAEKREQPTGQLWLSKPLLQSDCAKQSHWMPISC